MCSLVGDLELLEKRERYASRRQEKEVVHRITLVAKRWKARYEQYKEGRDVLEGKMWAVNGDGTMSFDANGGRE